MPGRLDAASLPPAQATFWRAFLAATGRAPGTAPSAVFFFADNEEDATELAALVLAGAKLATASLVWTCEAEGGAVPAPGDLSLVTAFDGVPLCVIETTEVEIHPFERVPADFAAAEGEGDRSLGHWRRVHWDYFGRECRGIGRRPDPAMPVVCERFRLLYPALARSGTTSPAPPGAG